MAGWTAVVQWIIVVASSVYSYKQQSKMKKNAKAAAEARKGFQLVVEGAVEAIPIVYGRAMIGGTRVYHNTSSSFKYTTPNGDKVFETGSGEIVSDGDFSYIRPGVTVNRVYSGMNAVSLTSNINGSKNEFLFYQQVMCQGPINGVYDILVDNSFNLDEPSLGNNSARYVYKGGSFVNDKNQVAALRIDCHHNGGHDAIMAANFGDRKSAEFPGLAYISTAIRLDRDEPQFQGVPTIQLYIEGRKVKTVVRAGTPGSYTYSLSGSLIYSNNPAFCMLDYLMDQRCGKGLTADSLDLQSFYDAAVVCDTVVQTGARVAGKVWQPVDNARHITTRDLPLYECNIIVDTAKPVRENVEAFLSTMGDARLIWSQGKYKLSLQYPVSNAAIVLADTITDDDILHDKPVEVSYPSAAQRLNSCTVRFFNEAEDFKEDSVTWPAKKTETFKRGVGGKRYQPVSGWDTVDNAGLFYNSYGVWDGGTTSTDITYKFVPKETGNYAYQVAGDDYVMFHVNGAVINSSTDWKIIKSGTVALTAGVVTTIRLMGTDTEAARAVAATLVSPTGIQEWTTRSETYDSFIDVSTSDALYQSYLTEDNGVLLENSMFSEGITDYYHALAKAEEIVRLSRSAITIKFEYVMRSKFLEPGDIIKIDSETLHLGDSSDLFVKVDDVKIKEGMTCEIVGARFDYTQLAWSTKDSEFSKPGNLYSFGLTAPSYLTYMQGSNALRGSPGTLDWGLSPEPNLSGYILYFHEFQDMDSGNRPIFREIGRATAPPFHVPDLGSKVGVFGVAAWAGAMKSRITATSQTEVIRVDGDLDPPTVTDLTAELFGDFNQSVKLQWTVPELRANLIPYSDHKITRVYRAVDILPATPAWEFIGETLGDTFIDTSPIYGNLVYGVLLISARDLVSPHSNYVQISLSSGGAFTQSAIFYAYKRSASAPANNPGDVTYTFADKKITTPATDALANGWTKTIPTGTDPLYIVAATASNNTPTDAVAAAEWSPPQLMAQSAPKTATVFIYQRNDSATTPTIPNDGTPASYNFTTGALTTVPAGWSSTIPGTAGKYLWVAQATAISYTSADDVVDTEFSTPRVLAQNGDGTTFYFGTSAPDAIIRKKDGTYSPNSIVFQSWAQSGTTNPTLNPTHYRVNKGTGTTTITWGGAPIEGTGVQYTGWSDLGGSVLAANHTALKFEMFSDAGRTQLVDTVTVPIIDEGADAYTAYLTNEAVAVPCDAAGTIIGTLSAMAAGTFKIFRGSTDVTATATFGRTESNCTSAAPGAGTGTYSVTAMSADTAYVDYTATIGSFTATKRFSLSKVKYGNTGTSNHRVYKSAATIPATPSNTTLGGTPSTWSASPIPDGSIPVGEAQWQSDGTTAAGGTTTVWSLPYLSYLKVGSLEVVSNVVAGGIQIQNGGKLYSGKVTSTTTGAGTAGFFLGKESGTVKFTVGDDNLRRALMWDGTDLSLRVDGSNGLKLINMSSGSPVDLGGISVKTVFGADTLTISGSSSGGFTYKQLAFEAKNTAGTAHAVWGASSLNANSSSFLLSPPAASGEVTIATATGNTLTIAGNDLHLTTSLKDATKVYLKHTVSNTLYQVVGMQDSGTGGGSAVSVTNVPAGRGTTLKWAKVPVPTSWDPSGFIYMSYV